MESLPNYDRWKLQESPSEEIPHPLSCVDKVGDVVEFWQTIKTEDGRYQKYICGVVTSADNEMIEIQFSNHKTTHYLDDLEPFKQPSTYSGE